MNFRQQFLSFAAVATLALGGWGTMAFIGNAQPVAQTQPAGETEDTAAEPSYTGSITLDPAVTKGLSEADEATALQGLATINTATAETAATTANPGTTVVKSTLENENGYLVYSVELSNGLDVKVDAGDGAILHSEQDSNEEDGHEQEGNQEGDNKSAEVNEADGGSEADDTDTIQDEAGKQDDGEQDEVGDTDNVQDEQDGQPDAPNQTPTTEANNG